MKSKTDIENLLHRFYQGESTPTEEMALYLALLSEPAESPYAADRALVQASLGLAGRASDAQPQQVTEPAKWRILQNGRRSLLKYLAAAVVVLGIGIFTLTRRSTPEQPSATLFTAQGSYINNVPLEDEQAMRIAQRTMHRVAQCYQARERSQEEVTRTINRVQESLQEGFYSRMPEYMHTVGY